METDVVNFKAGNWVYLKPFGASLYCYKVRADRKLEDGNWVGIFPNGHSNRFAPEDVVQICAKISQNYIARSVLGV